MNIGLFDSGIGGLTVLREIVKLAPHNKFIYLADTDNLPYGNKTREQLVFYADSKINWMRRMQVDVVSIACNTTDSVIGSRMNKYSDMNIVNIIFPTANGILKNYSKIKKIGVLATEATAKNFGYENAFKSSDIEVMTIPCPGLVPWIESGMHDYDLGYKLVHEYMQKLFDFEMDGLIYGCTHYEFANNVIKDVIMKKYKEVQIFNPATFAAQEVLKRVVKQSIKSEFEFYITNISSKNRLQNAVIELFGFKPKVKLVNLST